MSVSLNDLLRLQREQARAPSTSTSLSLTYRPDTPPPEVFRQQSAPTDYPRQSTWKENLRAQLQVDDPTTPAASMETMGRDWLEWRLQQQEGLAQALLGTPPSGVMRFDAAGQERPLTEAVDPEAALAYGPGGIAGAISKLPSREAKRIQELVRAANAGARSKAQLLPEPNVSLMETLAEAGKKEPSWYKGSAETYKEMYGPYENLARGFNAAASSDRQPGVQADVANRALRLYRSGVKDWWTLVPHYPGPREEMRKMAELFEMDPSTNLREALATAYKRRDYYDAMGGRVATPPDPPGRNRMVQDRHMGDIIFPEGAFRKAGGDRLKAMYTLGDNVADVLARRRGLDIDTYQGQLWIAQRKLKGMLKDNEPFAEILRRRGEVGPDYQHLKERGLLDHIPTVGRQQLAMLLAVMAGAGAAATGASEARE